MSFIAADYRHILPWFIPGTAVAMIAGLVVARYLARTLQTQFWIAWGLIVALGMIISATLTPLHGNLNLAAVGSSCDLSRIGLAPLHDVFHIDDTSLNIVLFIPLGLVLGLLRRSRGTALLIAGAIALPVVIETTQLLVPALERGCQSADVFDNLTGLTVGFVLGAFLRWMILPLAEDHARTGT